MSIWTAKGYRDVSIVSRPHSTGILPPEIAAQLIMSNHPSVSRDEPALWSRLFDVPNRLYGTTINSEGDAI